MIKFRSGILSVFVGFAAAGGLQSLQAQSGHFEEFALINSRFDLSGGLLNLGDGYFYGAARWAESASGGLIYRIAPGQEAEVLHKFESLTDTVRINAGGSNPNCPLIVGHDGALYGATDGGGSEGMGTIFRFSPDGVFSVLEDTPAVGGIWSMVATPDGRLMTSSYLGGGTEGAGCLMASGPDGIFRVVSTFYRGPHIPSPVPVGSRSPFGVPGGLIVGSDGGIYGSFARGGLIHAQGSSRITYGGMFRHDSPGQEVILRESNPVETIRPEVAVDGGFVSIVNEKLVRISLTGEITPIATFPVRPEIPSVSLVQGDAIYGMSFYGGEHLSGYFFRHTPEEGIVILHQFTRDYYSRQRCLVAGNDGMVYGIAVLPPGIEPSTPDGGAAMSASIAASGKAAGIKGKKGSKYATRAFRFKPDGASANFVPVAKPDIAWLPSKSSGGLRTVEVDVLKNDRDPDGNPLTLAGLGEGTDPSFAAIVDTPKGPRIRISTSETDPRGRLITYKVTDGQGGTSTGRLAVKSPVTGSFVGTASGGEVGHAEVPLEVTFGKNQSVTATLRMGEKIYSGKGRLDIDETGDISLKARGAPGIVLHIDLLRGVERRIQVIFARDNTTFAATCTIQALR